MPHPDVRTPGYVSLEIARASRRRNGDPAVIEQKRRELAEAKIVAYVDKVLAEAPPLTAEQRDRLAVLLRDQAS